MSGFPAGLRRCHEIHDFLSSPSGACLLGPSYVYYFVEPGFTGFGLWGVPSRADIELLNRAMDVVLGPLGGPHLSLIETSGLASVEPSAFACMASYLARRFDAFKRVIRRQALVRPGGLVGSVVAGFYTVLDPPYPVAVFTDVAAAFGWLGFAHDHPIRGLVAELNPGAGSDSLLSALRRELALHEEPLGLESCARQLGVSPRTLQRRLTLAGTTYRRELNVAQVRRAQRLMLDGRHNLGAIAFEVGCSSPQRFSALFKEVTGSTPRDWLRAQASAPRAGCA